MERYFFRASAADFKKIPGSPIAYWPSHNLRNSFNDHKSLVQVAQPKQGLATTDNNRFLRYWFECENDNIYLGARGSEEAMRSSKKWFPCQKGGEFRKWYGNNEYVVNWNNNGEEIKKVVIDRYGSASKRVANEHLYFKEGITWSSLSSSSLSMRYVPYGFIFETKGSMCFFASQDHLYKTLGFCNSNIVNPLLQCISPTLDYHEGPIGKLPIAAKVDGSAVNNAKQCIEIGDQDWNSFETSWDFTSLPLLDPDYRQPTLKATYQKLRAHWREMTLEMQRLEEENNRIFIEAYGLQDELTPEVPLNEITLTCNPHYRYGSDKSEEELEALLLADTMRELVSYAVGCMFGRYALDKPGLILANQGETIKDYYSKIGTTENTEYTKKENDQNISSVSSVCSVVENSFPADANNVIPMLDGNWFSDDIAERFKQFLKVAFGAEHYEDNLRFVEESLNIKGRRNYSIRDYFLGEFYTDHVKRYKKRPIYWLFSSPKGSFNALIYMHRYRPDTVSVVLNDYLREFRTKLTSHKNHLEAVSISAGSSQGEKTKALKEIEKITKIITELEEYEREVLYPLATEQVKIDLDDGVKINYPKFGQALKKIPGLEAKDD
jgi:type II restriction/modification system DNA methylase subunit YeeA